MNLKEAIASLLKEQPGPAAIQCVIEESHRLAVAYLKMRARDGKLEVRCFGLSLDDLALDSLVDLFQRDEHGRFVQLIDYFESIGWQGKDAAGLHIALRRLVFSQVNERFSANMFLKKAASPVPGSSDLPLNGGEVQHPEEGLPPLQVG